MNLRKLAIATLLITSASSTVAFADVVVEKTRLDNNSGVLSFKGNIVKSPCNLDDSSKKVQINFGEISDTSLKNSEGKQKDFQIKLVNCDVSSLTSGSNNNIKITFSSKQASTDNSYINTSDDSNVGIYISDFKFNQPMSIQSQLSDAGTENELNFTAALKKIDHTQPVKTGKFAANAKFKISYE